MKFLLVLLALVGRLLPAGPPLAFRLDVAGGVGGIRFDEPTTGVASGVQSAINGVGKRWRTTHHYRRPGDITQLHGLGKPARLCFHR